MSHEVSIEKSTSFSIEMTSKYLTVAITKSQAAVYQLMVYSNQSTEKLALVSNILSPEFKYKVVLDKKLLQWTFQKQAFGVQLKCKNETGNLEECLKEILSQKQRF